MYTNELYERKGDDQFKMNTYNYPYVKKLTAAAPPIPQEPAAPPPPPPPVDGGQEYDIFSMASIDADRVSALNEQRTLLAAGHKAALMEAAEQKNINLDREKEEHTRRVEAESRKKRKLQTQRTSGPTGPLLKRANSLGGSFSVFGDDEEEYETVSVKQPSAAVGSDNGKAVSTGKDSSPPLDPDLIELVTKTANWAANNLSKYKILLQNSKSNAKLFFLNDKLSPAGILFTEQFNRIQSQLDVQRVCSEAEVPSISSTPRSNAAGIMNPPAYISKVTFASCEADSSGPSKPARKNRWGPPANQMQVQVNKTPEPAVVDPIYHKQVREQKEIQLLVSRMREAASRELWQAQKEDLRQLLLSGGSDELQAERLKQLEELAALDHDSRRDTIDDAEANNGVIEGGSWEHRKRAKEMLATAQKSAELTILAADKHHLADFLPAAELNKFIKKSEAVAKGEKLPFESDYADHKLAVDNVGYQILQNAGWVEGSSLGGSDRSSINSGGIVEPISVQSSQHTAGIGALAAHEAESGDSEFESYRKRMMLAYRFRPNPLNNPRRDYY